MNRLRSEESGAAMVELAFVLVLLVMLLVGTISAAVAFGRDNSIQNAAREASRFAATQDGPVDLTWLQNVHTVARAAALGDLDSGVDGWQICVAYVNGSEVKSLTDNANVTPVAYGTSECFDDGRSEARVQVAVQRDTPLNAVVFTVDVTLSAEAAARYERE